MASFWERGLYIADPSWYWWFWVLAFTPYQDFFFPSSPTTPVYRNATESLNSIEERLPGNNFFRSHRAYIVNLNMVREIRPWGKNSYEITFSGTREKALLASNKARELEKILALPGS
jgi:hypothetical protein